MNFSKVSVTRKVLLFLGPPASSPGPWPPAPFTFSQPTVKITFSWPLTMELLFHGPPASKITFSWSLVIIIVCHVFFYSFKQNSAYSLFENFFQQNVLSYTNQLQCESIGCFLYDAN